MKMTLEPHPEQLISYIALSAPATRRLSLGNEPFLRPEIGFTPKWFHTHAGVDLGKRWHSDPAYRRDTIIKMAKEIRKRFGDHRIGALQNPNHPQDLLTGTFGTCVVAGIYGIPCAYQSDNWPWSEKQHISEEEADNLEAPDLNDNRFFAELMDQLDWIARESGRVEGYVNWQGVLNNAYRLRGQSLFIDMLTAPERSRRIFDCVTGTMIEAARRVYDRQRKAGVERHHFTVSNCLVNMVSPDQYREFLLPCDRRIAESFRSIGVHNCAWNIDPYMDEYVKIPHLSYLDMGIESDLSRAREVFPTVRRALMYTPMDVVEKSSGQIRSDLEEIAQECGPCDIVFADLEAGTPDGRVLELLRFCDEISQQS